MTIDGIAAILVLCVIGLAVGLLGGWATMLLLGNLGFRASFVTGYFCFILVDLIAALVVATNQRQSNRR